jgi:hypothetical protein
MAEKEEPVYLPVDKRRLSLYDVSLELEATKNYETSCPPGDSAFNFPHDSFASF